MWKGGGKCQGSEAVGLPGEPLLVWLLSLWHGGGCTSPGAAAPSLCPLQRGELQDTQQEVLGSQYLVGRVSERPLKPVQKPIACSPAWFFIAPLSISEVCSRRLRDKLLTKDFQP